MAASPDMLVKVLKVVVTSMLLLSQYCSTLVQVEKKKLYL